MGITFEYPLIEYKCLDEETGHYEFVFGNNVRFIGMRVLNYKKAIPKTYYSLTEEDRFYHSEEGPAKWEVHNLLRRRTEVYYVNNKRHRLDGPAWCILEYTGKLKDPNFYVDGVKYNTEIEYWIAVDKYLKEHGNAYT